MISISHPSATKTLESYGDFYIFEQRGWRVKFTHTGSVENDQLARTLADESDIQGILPLAGVRSSDQIELPEIDIRRVCRTRPFCYSINPAVSEVAA